MTASTRSRRDCAQLAPGLAARTDLRNPRRLVRALEIAVLRGDAPLPEPVGYPSPVLGLQLVVEPAEHRRRIEARARAQFDAGLVEEARTLRERFDPALPAFSAIGYRESWAYLDGEVTLDEAIALDAARNVAFAKRQRTWFRAEPALQTSSTDEPIASGLLDEVLALARGASAVPDRLEPHLTLPSRA